MRFSTMGNGLFNGTASGLLAMGVGDKELLQMLCYIQQI